MADEYATLSAFLVTCECVLTYMLKYLTDCTIFSAFPAGDSQITWLCFHEINSNDDPYFFCNQRNRYTQTVNICTRGVLRNWSLKTHMGDRRQMNDVQSRAALIYWCVWALNGSNNIQKLLFSCAGGRCWEILQSMQVVGRERQGNLKRRRAEEVWNSPIRWKQFFFHKQEHQGAT